MRVAVIVLPLVALAACSTPREACVADARRDLSTLNALIAQTQGNIDRGFAIEERRETIIVPETCEIDNGDGTSTKYECPKTETTVTNVPVAIDLNSEQAKLRSMIQRRNELEPRVNAAIEQCIRIHPE